MPSQAAHFSPTGCRRAVGDIGGTGTTLAKIALLQEVAVAVLRL